MSALTEAAAKAAKSAQEQAAQEQAAQDAAESESGQKRYDATQVGDYTILTPEDDRPSIFQRVTPREQYKVARDVANRAINEINAIRANRPSSFTGGINDANIAARMRAAETYGATLPRGSEYDRARKFSFDEADSYRRALNIAPPPPRIDVPVFEPDEEPNEEIPINAETFLNSFAGPTLGSIAGFLG